MSFSSNSQFLISGGDNGYIKIWNLKTGVLTSSFHAHSAGISSVIFSFNNQVIISSSWDKTVKLWIHESAIPKTSIIGFFKTIFGKNQAEVEFKASLPNFLHQKIKENINITSHSVRSKTNDSSETEVYSFIWETSQAPFRTSQMSLDDWHFLLKEWRCNEEKRTKEQRAKERLRLRAECLKLEQEKEERFQREQKLREEKLRQHEENLRTKQEIREKKQRRHKEKHQNNINSWNNTSNQKQTSNFWSSNSSTNSNNKIYVQGYRRKDGTYVEGYWREK